MQFDEKYMLYAPEIMMLSSYHVGKCTHVLVSVCSEINTSRMHKAKVFSIHFGAKLEEQSTLAVPFNVFASVCFALNFLEQNRKLFNSYSSSS